MTSSRATLFALLSLVRARVSAATIRSLAWVMVSVGS
jgi:hypothetical protein